MNRIPANLNFTALIGKSVEQVCIGIHQVIIRLEDSLSIAIEGDFSFGVGTNIEKQSDYRRAAHSFAMLLGCNVSNIEVIDDRTLSFEFSSENYLRIFDSKDYYESFQIKLPERLIVV